MKGLGKNGQCIPVGHPRWVFRRGRKGWREGAGGKGTVSPGVKPEKEASDLVSTKTGRILVTSRTLIS